MLLQQDLDLRLAGVHIQRLRLNRHHKEAEWVPAHHHAHAQVLLYLNGGGLQSAGSREHAVLSGSIFFIPRRTPHAFIRTSQRRPLSLIVDLNLGEAREVQCTRLTQTQMNFVRSHLSHLFERDPTREAVFGLARTGHALLIVDQLLEALFERGTSASQSNASNSPVVRAVETALADPAIKNLSLKHLADRIGYQRDYLNRVLRNEVGLTLGQLRAERTLDAARNLLLKPGIQVQTVSAELGFSDQNYFARWFRKFTGMSPGKFQQKSS
jgi:AraC-like DNA-binding protein